MGRFLATVLALIGVSGAANGAPVTVVAFNVESGDASDHVISLQLEKSVGVDLWGLADVWDERGWPDRLKEGAAFDEGSAFGSILGETGGDSRLQVLYRQDRLRPLETEEIRDAQVSDREAAPLAARLRLDDEVEFWFVVVNLSDSDHRRLRQTRALADWAGRQSLPIVVAGTFRFGVAQGDEREASMDPLLDAGWRWARPGELVGTSCGDRDEIQDFVFLAGPAVSWGARSEVMFPQNNYCPDSGRTSSHRPVLANLEPEGNTPEITGSMPERQIRPFFPEEMDSSARVETPLAHDLPARGPSRSDSVPSQPGDPGAATGTEPSRAALMNRLEALQLEMEQLRRQIEALPD